MAEQKSNLLLDEFWEKTDPFGFACKCSTLGCYLNYAKIELESYENFKKSAEIFAMLYERDGNEEPLIHLGAALIHLEHSNYGNDVEEKQLLSRFWAQRRNAVPPVATLSCRSITDVSKEKQSFERFAYICDEKAINYEIKKDRCNQYKWNMRAAHAYARLITYLRNSDYFANLGVILFNMDYISVERDILMEKALAVFLDDYIDVWHGQSLFDASDKKSNLNYK